MFFDKNNSKQANFLITFIFVEKNIIFYFLNFFVEINQ